MSLLDDIRVLVVDDHRDEAEALAASLELDGYQVRVATGAHEALQLLPGYQPHCVMLDIDMPDMDGIELSRRLREAQGSELIIIAVTGWGSEDQRISQAFEFIDHCLRKPFDPVLLQRLLPPLHI